MNYTKNMPEIELLMQVWPEEIEEVIKTIDLPGVDMDIGLEDYVSLVSWSWNWNFVGGCHFLHVKK